MLFTECPRDLDTLIREFAAPPQDLATACLLCIETLEDARARGEEITKPVIRCNGHYLSFQTEAATYDMSRVIIYEQPDPELTTDEVRQATQANGEGPGDWIFDHDELIIYIPSHTRPSANCRDGTYWCHYIWFETIERRLQEFCDASRLTPEIGAAFIEDFPANGEGGPAEAFHAQNHWTQP